ncbi:hypothetical protein BDZ91DRAFT_759117 [Kalaharituber pfeilii]|nr:hypothetical protein BDZ91DRAFT_759117 [Kalaharituber pfeilii]
MPVSSKVENLRRRAISASGFGPIDPRPPPRSSPAYDLNLATLASKVLYRSGPDPSGSGGPLLILCASAFPDTRYVDYNKLLPYVLSELPADDELVDGVGYSVVFFAGAGGDVKPGGDSHGPVSPGAGGEGSSGVPAVTRWNRPAWSWSLQAYNLLSRAVRKNIRKLWIVHERAWVRILFEMLQTVISPKFKKKVVHVATLSELATHIPLHLLNIPPSVYLHDRKLSPTITIPNPPPPVFGVPPFPTGDMEPKLPYPLMDASRYLRTASNLKTEGLFRITASMQLMEIVREAYDRGQYLRMNDYGPHLAAGLIKLYYRSLPEPLIPRRYYAELSERCRSQEEIKKLLTCHESKGGLPATSRTLLTRHLLPLLTQVTQYAQVNRMTAENLAICISPSLVRSDDPLLDMTVSRGAVCQIIHWGIEHNEELAPALPVRTGKREMNSKKVENLIVLDDDEEKEKKGEEVTVDQMPENEKEKEKDLLVSLPPPTTARPTLSLQAHPTVLPRIPTDNLPLSLQPAVPLTTSTTTVSATPLFPPPTIPVKPKPHPETNDLDISTATSTCTATAGEQAMVNTRRPSSHSAYPPPTTRVQVAKIDCSPGAVAESVARFQRLAAETTAGAGAGAMVGGRAGAWIGKGTGAGTGSPSSNGSGMMSGRVEGQAGSGGGSSGIPMSRTHQPLLLPQGKGEGTDSGEGVEVLRRGSASGGGWGVSGVLAAAAALEGGGATGVVTPRTLQKARSELELKRGVGMIGGTQTLQTQPTAGGVKASPTQMTRTTTLTTTLTSSSTTSTTSKPTPSPAHRLTRAKSHVELTSRVPPSLAPPVRMIPPLLPVPTTATTPGEVDGEGDKAPPVLRTLRNRNSSMVGQLRALYEERARGVEVLVGYGKNAGGGASGGVKGGGGLGVGK